MRGCLHDLYPGRVKIALFHEKECAIFTRGYYRSYTRDDENGLFDVPYVQLLRNLSLGKLYSTFVITPPEWWRGRKEGVNKKLGALQKLRVFDRVLCQFYANEFWKPWVTPCPLQVALESFVTNLEYSPRVSRTGYRLATSRGKRLRYRFFLRCSCIAYQPGFSPVFR